tara:strand:+ start:1189 stop:1872 length:684 start_codon:yes stop_codon:yes gene_type:complete
MLSTKDVADSQGGGQAKTITPGKNTLKINSINLKRYPFMDSDEGYFLLLNTETKPIEGFEGFLKNPDDESKGRYDGQIGTVKTNRYYYKNGQTKSGIKISRDMEILKQLKSLCRASGCIDWFDEADGKYNTIEEFVTAFDTDKPFEDIWFNIIVAGKEFERKTSSYVGYDLFFPKGKKGMTVIEAEGAKESKLMTFNEDDHWTKLQPKVLDEGFDGGDTGKAPEFDL